MNKTIKVIFKALGAVLFCAFVVILVIKVLGC